MIKHALTTLLLLCPAAAAAQDPLAADCGATPAAEACVAKPKNTDIFGLPAAPVRTESKAGAAPAKTSGAAKKTAPPRGTRSGAAAEGTAAGARDAGELPDFSRLQRASTALHLWLGLAFILLAAAEAFAADNPGWTRTATAGAAGSFLLVLAAVLLSWRELGTEARALLSFKPGFLLYYASALLAGSAALALLLHRAAGPAGRGFWGAAAAFLLAASGGLLLAVHLKVNAAAAVEVMTGHVPVGAALLAAGAAAVFRLFRPARAALAVFLFIAGAMSGLYRENPEAFSPEIHDVVAVGGAGSPDEAADKKGPRG
ncbi:MAG TPA: hypothetical protein PKK31_00455 [Elusimicrobiales bacterium]|nr:hypothetical protein [Elusimicrobiales bacterium]